MRNHLLEFLKNVDRFAVGFYTTLFGGFMKLQKSCAYILIALSSMMTISCGSGGTDAFGGDVFLATQRIAANANPSTIDSDIAVDAVDPGTIHKDTVSVAITSTATVTPALPFQVNYVIVSYIALNGGPALPSETWNINTTAAGGTTLTLAVDAATLVQKVNIIDPAYTGNPATLDYDVTLTFDVSEVGGTNAKSGNPVAKTSIHFANFKDS